ncbi:hypothetical protein EGW35_02540 [Enterococcus durans]|uniref:hypothetical protein n=1 Tax=Enterococcus durans TaxID=53345 RepID=UPI000F502E5F|nr:hypothetical protein [Enterococcus durans]ROX84558.1 hypothetical protein EGW35_02540 [Enterococcus durans]
MNKKQIEKIVLRNFFVGGYNDSHEYAKRNRMSMQTLRNLLLKNKATPEMKAERYVEQLARQLPEFLSQNSNCDLIVRKIFYEDSQLPFTEIEQEILKSFHKKVDFEQINQFDELLPDALISSEISLTYLSDRTGKSVKEIKEKLTNDIFGHFLTPFANEYGLERIKKTIDDLLTSENQSFYVNHVPGDVVAFIISQTDSKIKQIKQNYPEIDHWLIKLFEDNKDNVRFKNLRGGNFSFKSKYDNDRSF